MPQSVIMQRIQSFPQRFPVFTNEVGLQGHDRLTFRSEIRELGRSECTTEEIEKYQVIHPIGNAFEGYGIIEDGSEHEIIAISKHETFNMYKTEDNYVFLSNAKKAVIEHGIKRLKDGTSNLQRDNQVFYTERVTINLSTLKEEIQEGALGRIRGGWWRDLQIADVEVAYLGGGTVTDSDYWNTYEESEGIISALRLDVPNLMENEELLKVLLTKEGNLVIYKDVPTERQLLEIATTLFNLAKNHLE